MTPIERSTVVNEQNSESPEVTKDNDPDVAQQPSSSQPAERAPSRNRKRLLVASAAAVAAVAVAVSVAVAVQPSRLESAYNACAGDAWDGSMASATLLDAGDALSLEMTDGIDDFTVGLVFEIYYSCVFNELNVSEATLSRMAGTRALDGVQTANNDGLVLSWTYHPDNGLDVIIEVDG